MGQAGQPLKRLLCLILNDMKFMSVTRILDAGAGSIVIALTFSNHLISGQTPELSLSSLFDAYRANPMT